MSCSASPCIATRDSHLHIKLGLNSYAKVLGELQNSDVLGASGDLLDGVPPVRYYAFGDP